MVDAESPVDLLYEQFARGTSDGFEACLGAGELFWLWTQPRLLPGRSLDPDDLVSSGVLAHLLQRLSEVFLFVIVRLLAWSLLFCRRLFSRF